MKRSISEKRPKIEDNEKTEESETGKLIPTISCDTVISNVEEKICVDFESNKKKQDDIIIWSGSEMTKDVRLRYAEDSELKVITKDNKMVYFDKTDEICDYEWKEKTIRKKYEGLVATYYCYFRVSTILDGVEKGKLYKKCLEVYETNCSRLHVVEKEDKQYVIKTPKMNNLKSYDVLLHEIELLREMDNVNIIRVEDSYFNTDINNGSFFMCLVTEKGEDLRKVIIKKAKELDDNRYEKWCIKQLEGILNGLDYLHRKNYVHEDIKTDNIIVIDDVPKIIDFGITHLSDDFSTFGGTLGYLAPEKRVNLRGTEKSDIWSVGVIGQIMLDKGEVIGKESEQFDQFNINTREIKKDDIERIRNGTEFKDLRELVLKMLVEDQDDRWNAHDLLNFIKESIIHP